jgi:phosphoribosylformimino-5-aminoimidazole carboxamide ribotide isomerase
MEAFTVIPAIDFLEGRCVRLSEGRRERVTIEGGDPGEAAAHFAAEGASWLHLVDLDGAFSGQPTPGLVERAAAGVPVAGRRRAFGRPEAMETALSLPAAARTRSSGPNASSIGTRLEASPLSRFGEKLVVAIDAKDGLVVTDGWVTETRVSARELAGQCAAAGIARLSRRAARRRLARSPAPTPKLLADVLAAGLPVLAAGEARGPARTSATAPGRPRLRGRGRRKRPLVRPVQPAEALAYCG